MISLVLNLDATMKKSMRRLDLSKLVKKPVQVHGHDGKVFTRYQWVNPSDASVGHGVRLITNLKEYNEAMISGMDNPDTWKAMQDQGVSGGHLWGEHPHFYLPETSKSAVRGKDLPNHIPHGKDHKNHKIYEGTIPHSSPSLDAKIHHHEIETGNVDPDTGKKEIFRIGQYENPEEISTGHGIRRLTTAHQILNFHSFDSDPNALRALHKQGFTGDTFNFDLRRRLMSMDLSENGILSPVYVPDSEDFLRRYNKADHLSEAHRVRLWGEHFDHGVRPPDHSILPKQHFIDTMNNYKAKKLQQSSEYKKAVKSKLKSIPRPSGYVPKNIDLDKLYKGTSIAARFANVLEEHKLMSYASDDLEYDQNFPQIVHEMLGGISKSGFESLLKHEKSQLSAKLIDVEAFPDQYGLHTVRLTCQLGKGKNKGALVRTLTRLRDGGLQIDNDLLAIPDKHQKSGYADHVYNNTEELWKYLCEGNKSLKIGIQANISVGVYTWAKRGFEFEDEYYLLNMINDLKGFMSKHNLPYHETLQKCGVTENDLISPRHFADLDNGDMWDLDKLKHDASVGDEKLERDNISGLAHLGKAFLLTGANSWRGVKTLIEPKSTGGNTNEDT